MYIKTRETEKRAFPVNIMCDKTVIKLQNRFITTTKTNSRDERGKGHAIILFSQCCDFVCGAHESE